MRNIQCDVCDSLITEHFYEVAIYKYNEDQDIEEDESYEFCSEKCMGKWMVATAKEEYGVFG